MIEKHAGFDEQRNAGKSDNDDDTDVAGGGGGGLTTVVCVVTVVKLTMIVGDCRVVQ